MLRSAGGIALVEPADLFFGDASVLTAEEEGNHGVPSGIGSATHPERSRTT